MVSDGGDSGNGDGECDDGDDDENCDDSDDDEGKRRNFTLSSKKKKSEKTT